jgi:hypothetical protein
MDEVLMESTPTQPYPTDHWELSSSEIAYILGEEGPEHVEQIKRFRRLFGPKRSQGLLNKTLAIEARGGLLTADGSRRRTVPSVFWELVHKRTKGQWKNYIFKNGPLPSKSRLPSSTGAQPPRAPGPAPPPPASLAEALATLPDQPGAPGVIGVMPSMT